MAESQWYNPLTWGQDTSDDTQDSYQYAQTPQNPDFWQLAKELPGVYKDAWDERWAPKIRQAGSDFYEDVQQAGGVTPALAEKLTNLPYVGNAFKGWETIGAGMANEDVMATNPIYQWAKNKLYPAVDEWRKSKEQAQTGVGYPIPDRNIYPPQVQDFEFSEYQGPSKEVEGDYPVGKKGFQFPSFLREGLGAIRDMIPNPLRKGSSNYNPRLEGQMADLKARNMLGDVKWSEYPGYGAGKITGGPLAGQNLVSGFGTNDYNEMLQKRIDYFNRQKEKKGKLTDEQDRRRTATILELQTTGGGGAPIGPAITDGGGYQGPRTYDFDRGQFQREGRRPDKPGGHTDPGRGSYGPHRAQGGYMRSRYSNGGRVGILAAF